MTPLHLFTLDGCYFSADFKGGHTEADGVHSKACWCQGRTERLMLDGLYEWRALPKAGPRVAGATGPLEHA